MSTLTVFSDAADGDILSQNDTVYSNARDGTGTFFLAETSGTTFNVGQNFSTPTYFCYEGFLSFDTSSLSGDTITAATLSVFDSGGAPTTNFTLNCRLHDWGTSVTTADWVAFNALSAKTLLAHLATSGWSANAYNALTDDAFAANVNASGSTRVILSSSRFESGTTPTNNERVTVFAADNTGTTKDPKLVITYTVPGAVLAATPAMTSVVTAALTVLKPLAATPAMTSVVTANLTSDLHLAATPAGLSVVTASLTVAKPLAATPAMVSVVTAALTVPKPFAATPAALSVVTANLTSDLHLAATPAMTSVVTAALTVAKPLAATIAATSTVTADLYAISPVGIEVTAWSFSSAGPGSVSTAYKSLMPTVREVSFTVQLNEVGAASFKIAADDPFATATNIAGGNGYSISLRGHVRYAFFNENPVRVAASPDGSAGETWLITGRGWESYLEREIVRPAGWPPASGTLAHSTTIGQTTGIKLNDTSALIAGDTLVIGAVGSQETAVLTFVGTSGLGGTGVNVSAPLTLAHANAAAWIQQLASATFDAADYPGVVLYDLLSATTFLNSNVVAHTFTNLVDDVSAAWSTGPAAITISFNVGTTLLDAWRTLAGLDLFTRYVWAGSASAWDVRLKAYAVDPSVDRSTSVIFRAGKHLSKEVENALQYAKAATRCVVRGKSGGLVEYVDPAEDGASARALYIAVGGSDDPNTLYTIAQKAVAASQANAQSITLPVLHGTGVGQYEPFTDYDVGDWIALDVPGTFDKEKFRIVGMTVAQDPSNSGEYTVELTLNSILYDLDVQLQRQIDALSAAVAA